MSQSKRSQSNHDRAVRQWAQQLKDQGYRVKADVAGFSRPDTVGGYRPDVDARRHDSQVLGEVETPDSVGSASDQKQQAAFRAAARRSEQTRFVRRITKS